MKKKLFAMLLAVAMLVSVFGGALVASADGDTLGSDANDAAFWSVHSDVWAAPAGKAMTMTFTNNNDGGANWNNFLVVLQSTAAGHSADDDPAYSEYAVLRADNFGWGAGYGTAILESDWDWSTFMDDMNGAKVTLTIVNHGDGIADVYAKIVTAEGVEHFQNYKNITVSGDLYFCLTLEKAYLTDIVPPVESEITAEQAAAHAEADEIAHAAEKQYAAAVRHAQKQYENLPTVDYVGTTDSATPFWGDHSDYWKVEQGESSTVRFINHNSGEGANWNNFLIVLRDTEDGANGADGEYAVLRADNWGWGKGFETAHKSAVKNWKYFVRNLNGAKVTATVAYNTDNTADVLIDILGSNNHLYKQDYTGITVDGDLYYGLTVDNAWLEILGNEGDEPAELPWEPTWPESADDVESINGLIGSTDYSMGWVDSLSGNWKVDSKEVVSKKFINHSNKTYNWNNFMVQLHSEETENAVVRADNYGWSGAKNTFEHLTDLGWTLSSNWNWDTFKDFIDGSTVVVSVANYGDDTASVHADLTKGTESHYQYYDGIAVDSDDLYFSLAADGAYLTPTDIDS
ncbi:MAG: hypothetical protein IJR17_05565 [Clostridia bacterium]|nr:hypothetical protein [Clostridia bacterium]